LRWLYLFELCNRAAEAAFAVTVWTGVGLFGDAGLVLLLERVKGLAYLRYSVLLELWLFPTFLLLDDWTLKLIVLGIIGFCNAGWYSILQGQLYSAMPGQSGAVLVIYNVSDWIGSLLPFTLGAIAATWGLETAMWSLAFAPLALLIGLGLAPGLYHEESDEPD
jgi:FSR family fosmidomycin resistance protein-like MFS transporter